MGKLCSPKSLVLRSGVGGREEGWEARGPCSGGNSGEGTRAKGGYSALSEVDICEIDISPTVVTR